MYVLILSSSLSNDPILIYIYIYIYIYFKRCSLCICVIITNHFLSLSKKI
ncbi:hypothetical protein Hanom_Chr09g00821781 [Helianthus anomalus]